MKLSKEKVKELKEASAGSGLHWQDLPHREDGPVIDTENYQAWYIKGNLHREGGPAWIDRENGVKEWYQHGKLHREDGPAVEYENGDEEWWLNGKAYSEKKFYKKMIKRNKKYKR